jgi:hypothetical protein
MSKAFSNHKKLSSEQHEDVSINSIFNYRDNFIFQKKR